jgi:hypothetical protein
VAGFLEKKDQFVILGQTCLKPIRDEPLDWEMAVADILETFQTWLPLGHLNDAEWIQWKWVEMILKTCASEVREARKKGRRGNMWLVMDLGEHVGKKAKGNVTELPNSAFMDVIRWVPNGNNDQTSSNQFQALYTDVRHWEELIDIIGKNCSPKEPYCLTAIYKCNLMQEELDEEYIRLYAPRQSWMTIYIIRVHTTVRMKLGHDVTLYLVDMITAIGKDVVDHVMWPSKVIATSLVTVRYFLLLIGKPRLWRYPIKMTEWKMRRQEGARLIVLIM